MANKPVLNDSNAKVFLAMMTTVGKWGKIVHEDAEIYHKYKESYFDNDPQARLELIISRSANNPITFARGINAELEHFEGWKRSIAKAKGEYYDHVAKQHQPTAEESYFGSRRKTEATKRTPWEKS